MADSFAVHLGGGLYLDADGNLTSGPADKAQVYEAPSGFHVDTKKLQDTFKDLAGLLPKDDAAKAKWKEWGVPSELVDWLGKVAGVATIVATALSVYAWAIGVLLSIMGALSGDDGLSPAAAKTLNDMKNQISGLEEITRANHMIELYSQFDGRVTAMNGLLIELATSSSDRAHLFGQMKDIVDGLQQPLSEVRNQEWSTAFDSDAYKGRAFTSPLLVFQKSDGTLAPVPAAPATTTMFDYRLGVPMLLYVATTFTSLAQVAMPWYRSAGTYAEALRATADAIDHFVLRMQDECLARTEYSAQTVLNQQVAPTTDVTEPLPSPWPGGLGPGGFGATYAVGAWDVAKYSDGFLWERAVAEPLSGPDRGRRGLFNYHWDTPELDLQKIADAANEQAHQDYANLQASTGMLRLIQTAAWLRFLSTPRTTSETVTGSESDSRRFVDSAPTKAKSPSIFPIGVIEHDATLNRYQAQARVHVTTQAPGYEPQVHYRIVLRTIDSNFGNEGWDSRGYIPGVWDADYEPSAGDPRCKRLRTTFHQGAVLDERVLYDGPSPAATYTAQSQGPITLHATTFDWYVPVSTPWNRFRPGAQSAAAKVAASAAAGGPKPMVGTGGVSIHLLGQDDEAPVQMHVLSGSASLTGPLALARVDEVGVINALNEAVLDQAERRHVRFEDVQLEWQLTWNADTLDVALSGRPADRPFQAHVVVEETVYSGERKAGVTAVPSDPDLRETIHTPFVAEIVNQVVLVPEEFFVKEQDAIQFGSKLWHEFVKRFAKSAPVNPGDPIQFLNESIRESVTRSQSTATLVSALDKQAEFAREEAPELWDEVVRSANVPLVRD